MPKQCILIMHQRLLRLETKSMLSFDTKHPSGNWKGDCCNRMVHMVKSHLTIVLTNQTITKDELESVSPEIEYML